ncbi:MAG: radical SAM family heme chaperone HemW [Candidatus Limimorpha sp.]
MSGIYIHFPFCKSKCAYCNFYSVVEEQTRQDFLRSIKIEIEARKDYLDNDGVSTIYLGGGTPTLFKATEIQELVSLLHKNFKIMPEPEFTIEANPDTVNKQSLEEYRSIGINRISVGIQSFFDDDLQYLNRRHDSAHAMTVLEDIREAGFQETSLDLIYGIPTLTDEKWVRNLETAFASGADHLSAYALTIEEKTALARRITSGKAAPVDEDTVIRQYLILTELMRDNGFEHYEISNFARPGHHSRHNTAYWKGEKYIGLGPSAHSYNGNSRQWNISNIKKYNSLITNGDNSYFEIERLSPTDRYNEYIMTSLRTCWGCDIDFICKKFGEKSKRHFLKSAEPFINDGRLIIKGYNYTLSDEGMLFADGIAAELFQENTKTVQ